MQLDLFNKERSIQERFERFDEEHPEVYRLFRTLAERLLRAGRTHYSADAILHVIRFDYDVNPGHDEGFKLNDHFSSRYGRKLAGEDARFAEFFEFRRLKTACPPTRPRTETAMQHEAHTPGQAEANQIKATLLDVKRLGPDTVERNSRRLAACWNACEGISTADLSHIADHPTAIDRLRELAHYASYQAMRQSPELAEQHRAEVLRAAAGT